MNESVLKLKNFFIRDKAHHPYRQPAIDPYLLAKEFAKNKMGILIIGIEY